MNVEWNWVSVYSMWLEYKFECMMNNSIWGGMKVFLDFYINKNVY